jgi:diguanylate cyclase (GGDEF)-like protein
MSYARRLRCLPLWLCGLLLAGLAMGSTPKLSEYFRETWTTREGLPHNLVVDIAQTPEGYLWFATWEGAVRYSGREFTLYDRLKIGVLPDSGLRSLYPLGDGRLLFAGARGGLAIYAKGHWEALPPADGLINDVMRDSQGMLWAATDGFGLYRRGADGYTRSDRMSDGLAGDTVYAVLEDRRGRVLVGSSGGLQQAHAGGYTDLPLPGSGTPVVLSLALDGDGSVLVGTDRGVWRETTAGYAPLDPGLAGIGILRILVDRAGNRWFGTVDRGVMRLSEHGLEVIDTRNGLPNNRVLSLFEDREGSLWAGTNGGLFRLRDAPFSTYLPDDGLPDPYVRSVLQHSDGSFWVGTSGGLARAEGGRFVGVGADTALAGQSVLSLAEARDGGVWVGTYGDGLLLWREGRVLQHWTREDGLPAQEVRAILEAPDGELWVGTSHGLARIAGGQVQVLGGDGARSGDFVMALQRSADGVVYAGTTDGLRIVREGQLQNVDLSMLDGTRAVLGFHEDRARGELWLATDRGLVRYRLRDGDVRLLGREAGLPFDKYFAIVADREEQFWLSSNRGVVTFSQTAARAVIAGTQAGINWDLYGESDGMASAQCNGSSSPAATLAADGAVWVATARGAARVQPWRRSDFSARIPPAIIESALADGREFTLDGRAQLPAGTRRVEIDYEGLGYIVPERIRFRQRLRGLSEAWTEVDTLSVAVFTYLPPGSYVFEVAAAYPHGAWSDTAQLGFRIEAQLWQRPAFWVLLGLASLGLVLLGVQWRTRRLRLASAQLQAEVQSRTQALRLQADTLAAVSRERAALVEQLKQQAAAYERLALEDDLTGLPNRRAFDAALGEAGAAASAGGPSLALAMIDIDHFKRINDLWSHTTGDRAIVAVARALQGACASGEALCRWGGEEFVVLLPGISPDLARQRCEHLRATIEALDASHVAPGLLLTVSIGLALGPEPEAERLLVRADAALRRAKQAGRNRVMVDSA